MIVRQFSEKLVLETGNATDEEDHLKLLDEYVIGVISEIANDWDWDYLRTFETLTTVATQAEYSLQATAESVLSARVPLDDRIIQVVSSEWLRMNGYDLEQQLDTVDYLYPSGFDATNKTLKVSLWPVPTNAGTQIELIERKLLALDKDSESPFPSSFDELIKCGVRIRFNLDNKNYNDANHWARVYADRLEVFKGNKSTQPARRLVRREGDVKRREPLGPRLPSDHYRNY